MMMKRVPTPMKFQVKDIFCFGIWAYFELQIIKYALLRVFWI